MPIGDKLKQEENRKLLANPRVQAMLNTIAYAEGADYNTRVGGSTFNDLSKKPGKSTYIKSIGTNSTAEGRYQFLNSTWDAVAKDLGLTDFSPQSQDLAAIELIKRRGALDDVLAGNLEGATTKLAKEWASLPTRSGKSAYGGQRARSMESLRQVFEGGGEGSSYAYNSGYSGDIYRPYTPPSMIPTGSNELTSSINAAEEEDTAEEAEAKQTIDKVTTEQEILKDYFSQQQQPAQPQQQQEQVQEQADTFSPIGEQFAEVSQFVDTPLAQQGGAIKRDNEWLKNWYADRQIPSEDVQNVYSEDKPLYEQRLQNIPSTTNVPLIDNDPSVTGQYQGDTNKILMTPKAGDNVYLHELNHYANNFPSAMRTVHGEIVKQNILPQEKVKGIYKDKYDYFTNPDEIHSRIQVLRKEAGIKPNQKVTPEFMQNFFKTYKGGNENINDLMNVAEFPQLLEMLNYMAANEKGEERSNVAYAQQGGIPISSRGVYDYPRQEVIVPTRDGRITMQGVDYPILGVDEFGNRQMMYPNGEYQFGGKTIREIPQLKNYFNKPMAQEGGGVPFFLNPASGAPDLQTVLAANPYMGENEGVMVNNTLYAPSGELQEIVIPTKTKPKEVFKLDDGSIKFNPSSNELLTEKSFKELAEQEDKAGRTVIKGGLKEFPKEVKKEDLKGINIGELKDRESVKKIQKFLDERGYNLDPNNKFKNEGIDGVLGAVTKNAIEDYNRNLGVKGYSSIKEGEGNLGKCTEKQCSEYMQNEIYRNIQPKMSQAAFRDKIGLKGDAWRVVDNIVKAGGKRVGSGEVKEGDVVGIFNPTSNYLKEAKSGAGYTHTGVIDEVNPDGSYYILHNVHKKVGTDKRGEPIYEGREFRSKVDPKNNGVEGFGYTVREVARPAYEKVEKGETKTLHEGINLKFNKEKLTPEQAGNVGTYINSLNDFKTKSKIAQNYNLDEKEYQSLAKATIGILGKETKFGTDITAKPQEFVAGLLEDIRGEEASRGAGRFKYKTNRPSDPTYLGINRDNFTDPDKVALNSMDKLARDYKTLLDKGHSKKEAMYRTISAYNSGIGSKEKYNKEFDVDYTNKVLYFADMLESGDDKTKYKTYLDELVETSPNVRRTIYKNKSK